MSFEAVGTHEYTWEFGKDFWFTIGTERGTEQTILVFNGPGGLETTIRFDRVVVDDVKIQFYTDNTPRYGRGPVKCGQIEAAEQVREVLEQYGDSDALDYTLDDER